MKRFFSLLLLVAAVFAAASCDQQPPVTEKAPIVIYDGPVDLVDQEFGMYYGDLGHNSVGVYSVVFSDAVCFRDGYGTPYLDSEGDMLVLELIKESLLVVMPDGGEFKELDISSAQLPETVTEAYASSNGGYVFKLEATGYSSGLVILCGVYTDGTATRYRYFQKC